MQPLAATPLTPSRPETAAPGHPQPSASGPAAAASDLNNFAAMPFAWFFASALQPAPAPTSAAELPPEVIDGQGEAEAGNVLPLPAALPLTMPLPVPVTVAATAAAGGRVELAPSDLGAGGPVVSRFPLPEVVVPATQGAAAARLDTATLPSGAEGAPLDLAAKVPGPPPLGALEPEKVEPQGPAEAAAEGDLLALSAASRHTPPAAAPSARAENASLSPQVGDPRWAPALGERLVWMVEGEVKQAELRLNPPDLGPLEVRIAMVDDEARITFTAAHPNVREALEAALPRLREMLGTNGVNLVQVDVSGQGAGHRPPSEAPANAAESSHASGGRSVSRETLAPLGIGTRREGLFDAYA